LIVTEEEDGEEKKVRLYAVLKKETVEVTHFIKEKITNESNFCIFQGVNAGIMTFAH